MLTRGHSQHTDIKILFDIVMRAEELLPTLPEIYRRPIPALLKAYNEVLPEYGIHPEDDHQITKLVFKVGGVFGRGSLMDKFRTALSRMNITLELDVPQMLPANSVEYAESYSTSDDNSLSRGVPSRPTSRPTSTEDGEDGYPSTDNGRDDYSNAAETTDYTIPKDEYSPLDDDDSYTIPRSEDDTGAFHPEPIRKVPHNTLDVDAVQSRIEQNLEQSAIAFHDRYHTKFTVAAALRQWQKYSASLNQRWNQYREAVEWDMIGELEDTFRAWRIISDEAEEVPPPDIPSNIYSKRTEQIAVRTYQIFATKNAFTRWRRLAKERCRRRQHQAEVAGEPLDPMERLAIKAHENLVLSRAFVRWSNRSTQEVRKARMAAKIYELNLKSKAFGHRYRPDDSLFDTTLGEPADPAMDSADPPAAADEDEMFDDDYESAEMQRKAELARKGFLMRSLANRASEAANSNQAQASTADADRGASNNHEEGPQPTRQPAQLAHKSFSAGAPPTRVRTPAERSQAVQSIKEKIAVMASGVRRYSPVPPQERLDEKEEDESDERTLLARRHILRIRFFNAWENYTLKHTTKVKEFAVSKTIDPWRERVFELHDVECEFTRDREDRLVRGAFSAWTQQAHQAQDLAEKAVQVQQKLRVEYTMKPWIAASREKRRSMQQKSQVFEAWFDHEDDDAMLSILADNVYFSLRTRGALGQWRAAKKNNAAKRSVLKTYSERAEYYYHVTGALRAWKAASRQAAVRTSMKSEAFDIWRKACYGESPREEELKTLAGDINFSYSASKALPTWQARTRQVVQVRQQQDTYASKADYYYKTKGTLSAWRALAETRRKENIKKAHSEARRRIKRAMGERCIAQWRAQLGPRALRVEAMDAVLDEALADREWGRAGDALAAWRGAASQRTRARAARRTGDRDRARREALDRWRTAAADAADLADKAARLRADRAAARALRVWNLASLRGGARDHTAAHVRDKADRRLLRHGFEGWHARTLETAAAAHVDWLDFLDDDAGEGDGVGAVENFDDPHGGGGSGGGALYESRGLSPVPEHRHTPARARGPLMHSWQGDVGRRDRDREGLGLGLGVRAHMSANAHAVGLNNDISINPPTNANANDNGSGSGDAEVYVPTPGRPRLPLFGSATTTTPLAPVPSRARGLASWHPGGGGGGERGRGSVLRDAGAGRSRRNLRVSWAE